MKNKLTTVAVGDYALCQKLGQEDREVNGLIITSSQQALLSKALVLSVGNGDKIKKLKLKAGDVIMYNEIESNAIVIDGLGDGGYFIRHDFIMGKQNN